MKKPMDFKAIILRFVILFTVVAQLVNVLDKSSKTSAQETDWGFIANQMSLLLSILYRMPEVQSMRRENRVSAERLENSYTDLSRKNKSLRTKLELPEQRQIYDSKQQRLLDPKYFNQFSLLFFSCLLIDTFTATGFLSAVVTGSFVITDYRASKRLIQHEEKLTEAYTTIQILQRQMSDKIAEKERAELEKKLRKLEENLVKQENKEASSDSEQKTDSIADQILQFFQTKAVKPVAASQLTESGNSPGFFDEVSSFFRSVIVSSEDNESEDPVILSRE